MKRLKYRCLFGGKSYPMILTAAAAFGTLLFCEIRLELTWDSALGAAIFAAIAVMMLCFVWEHRLTPAEEKAIAECPLPLWRPVNEDIVDRVRSTKWFLDLEAGLLGGVFLFIGLLFGAPSLQADETSVIAPLCFLLGAAVLAVDFFCNMLWRAIDETAVYTFIPIDHMYDVTHHDKNGHDYTSSYLVFYQHDGRYVLRARAGSGDYGAVAVVKFRHMVTWVSVPRTVRLDIPEAQL